MSLASGATRVSRLVSPLLRKGRSFMHRNTLEQTAALASGYMHRVELRGSHSERSGSQWLSHAAPGARAQNLETCPTSSRYCFRSEIDVSTIRWASQKGIS